MLFPFCRVEAVTVNVFLVGGQSNADGRGDPRQLPVELQNAQTDVAFSWTASDGHSTAIYDSGYGWLVPGKSRFVVDSSSGTRGFGPEVSFGQSMSEFYAARGEKVAIIKYGNSGTNLYNEWRPNGNASTIGDGEIYKAFQNRVLVGLRSINGGLPDGGAVTEVKLAGMIWMQGESDTGAQSVNYETNLTTFITDVRSTFDDDLPFVIGQIADSLPANQDGLAAVRAAQASVAAVVPRTAMIVTDDYGLLPDVVHYDTAGQLQMGYDFATAMQSLIGQQSSPGDFNGDGVVNIADFTVWRDNLGAPDESGIAYNGDGVDGVTTADYQLWKTHLGQGSPPALPSSGTHSVPEPPMWLAGVLAAYGLMRLHVQGNQ
ncbi:sialate O-acetylesterase [Aeoliella sp. SH292]|uniref:sialate O-acetylesterase n=1 Tax=Aeoliella sp. SH292 TaxID=3454464 RepID=UPI003F9B257C